MIRFFFLSSALVLFTLTCFTSCKEEENTPQCSHTAYIGGTAVCYGEVALEIEGTQYLADNFSDFANIDDYNFGDSIKVAFHVTMEAPVGLLCGPLIVADKIELTCFEEL